MYWFVEIVVDVELCGKQMTVYIMQLVIMFVLVIFVYIHDSDMYMNMSIKLS